MNVTCTADPCCPILLNSRCVYYEGANLVYIGVNTNDSIQVALEKMNELFQSLVPVTGITAETIIYEVPIPPVLVVGSIVQLDSLIRIVPASSTNRIYRFRVSNTSGVAGTLLATYTITNATASSIPFRRKFKNNTMGPLGVGLLINATVGSTSLIDNQAGTATPSGGVLSSFTLDNTAPMYFQLTFTTGNAADVIDLIDFSVNITI